MMKSLTLVLMTSLAASTMAFAQGTPAAAPKAADKPPRSAACTIAKATTCKLDGACAPAAAIGEIKLPMKVTVDFQHHMLMSMDNDGFPVASPISTMVGGDGKVILQGVDRGIGWVLHGSRSDLKVSFAMTSHDTVLAAFGTCEIENDD